MSRCFTPTSNLKEYSNLRNDIFHKPCIIHDIYITNINNNKLFKSFHQILYLLKTKCVTDTLVGDSVYVTKT